MPAIPAWLVLLGRLLIYLPTILKLIPAVVQAVDDVIKAIKGVGGNPVPPAVVARRMGDLHAAIADARSGKTDGLIALYKLWKRPTK
jgi:hypothetical protein